VNPPEVLVKTCPDCAEQVQEAARKCRFCQYRFDEAERARERRRESADRLSDLVTYMEGCHAVGRAAQGDTRLRACKLHLALKESASSAEPLTDTETALCVHANEVISVDLKFAIEESRADLLRLSVREAEMQAIVARNQKRSGGGGTFFGISFPFGF
jgi:hypothetical protein